MYTGNPYRAEAFERPTFTPLAPADPVHKSKSGNALHDL